MIDEHVLRKLTPEERRELDKLLGSQLWLPMPGPQTMAYNSTANVIGYGGAAGGGKTDLALGLSFRHKVVQFFRRAGPELSGVIERLAEIRGGDREGLTGKPALWRNPGGICQLMEFCSVPNVGDERAYAGRAKDLLVIDEATNFLMQQVRFLMTWVRSVDMDVRPQTLLTFNPPVNPDGRWVIQFFAPWLDKKHPNPAKPGELRWYAVLDGRDVEVESEHPFDHKGETVYPQSRTFIPSRVTDNPYLLRTGYIAQLQSLEEPLRSMMLHGDFDANTQDSPEQCIPTAWVEAAMARWRPRDQKGRMTSLGVDVSRGGKDRTVIARRHGKWFDEPLAYAGAATPDGAAVMGYVASAMRNRAPIHIDAIGVGSSPVDLMRQAGFPVQAINVSTHSYAQDRSGLYGFVNLRSQLWWQMREALNPEYGQEIALPPNSILLSDLCAATWKAPAGKVRVSSTDEMQKVLGRSPDYGTAYVLGLIDTAADLDNMEFFGLSSPGAPEFDPFAEARKPPST